MPENVASPGARERSESSSGPLRPPQSPPAPPGSSFRAPSRTRSRPLSRPPRLDRRLLDAASAPYRAAGRFAYYFARGKLSNDPAFGSIVHEGWIKPGSRVLDLGCGQGLLASVLLAADRGCRVKGIELLPAEAQRARKALGDAVEIVCGDIQDVDFGRADAAVILDVLHYIDYEAQDRVLQRLRDALAPDGLLLLRVGDADGGLRFRYSNFIDRLVFAARGNRSGPLFCRRAIDWRRALESLQFQVEAVPLSQGTLFANVLLKARLRA